MERKKEEVEWESVNHIKVHNSKIREMRSIECVTVEHQSTIIRVGLSW